MSGKETREFCLLSPAGKTLIERVLEQRHLSAWAYDRILRVGRTIADLGESEEILPAHLAEAIQYRVLDRS